MTARRAMESLTLDRGEMIEPDLEPAEGLRGTRQVLMTARRATESLTLERGEIRLCNLEPAEGLCGAGQVLMTARRAMESLTLDRGEMHLKDELAPRYAELVYNGFWFSPERLALQAAVDQTPAVRHRRRARQALQGAPRAAWIRAGGVASTAWLALDRAGSSLPMPS